MRVVCPHCLSVNNIPKKDTYKKANCGKCKTSLLEKNLLELNQNSFDEVVVNSELPIIIDFWAPWCGPCKMMGPVFSELSKEYPLKTLFCKVNTEQEQNLAAKFGIKSIPTLIVFKNGIEAQRLSGALDQNTLRQLVNTHLE